MSYVTPHLMTPSTGTPSSLMLNPSLSDHKPCGDLRPQLSGALAEPGPFTGKNPSLLRTRITGISPKTSSSLNTRIYVSNPCPSTHRNFVLLASPLYLQEREASAERWQVCHSEREKLDDVQFISISDHYSETCQAQTG